MSVVPDISRIVAVRQTAAARRQSVLLGLSLALLAAFALVSMLLSRRAKRG